jgi:small redox-active disulfide protein 2
MKIEVLGAGCKKCHALAELAEAALKEAGAQGEVEHVTDLKRIMAYGVLSTPALVVNGRVKAAGRIPSAGEIKGWLREDAGR